MTTIKRSGLSTGTPLKPKTKAHDNYMKSLQELAKVLSLSKGYSKPKKFRKGWLFREAGRRSREHFSAPRITLLPKFNILVN